MSTQPLTYGTIGTGLRLGTGSWPAGPPFVFCSQETELGVVGPTCHSLGPPARMTPSKLKRMPSADVWMVDGTDPRHWGWWFEHLDRLPQVVLWSSPGDGLLRPELRATYKKLRKQGERAGFETRYWFESATDHGSALVQERLFVVMTRPGVSLPKPRGDGLDGRSMANLLLPTGIPSSSWLPRRTPVTPPPSSPAHGLTIIGRAASLPVLSPRSCMPDHVRAWVETDRGVRMLQVDELAKAKGASSRRPTDSPAAWRSAVFDATCTHLWAAVLDSVSLGLRTPSACSSPPAPPAPSMAVRTDVPASSASPTTAPQQEWGWSPPDLSEGGDWYNARVRTLCSIIDGWPDRDSVLHEGLAALRRHRANFTDAGPQFLQLLWWEFPAEHQDAIRRGSSMCFIRLPDGAVIPNSEMEPDALATAGKFVDELISLGVLVKASGPLKANCPLFCVPKPGQPGQWRCIADMKRGGQNACIGKGPVFLPRAGDILPHMYTGGWSAVADASKHFHNHPTVPKERPWLGCIHPITQDEYVYAGLPMGSSNSPAIACRIGNGALRMLRAEHPMFHGRKFPNTWREQLRTGRAYDPNLGQGWVFLDEQDEPVAHIWGFVDDFCVHAHTYERCCEAFSAFMDFSLRLGYICQVVKTSPPAQKQKFLGLIYDTTGVPTLRVPASKATKCQAGLAFLRLCHKRQRLSGLTLAAVIGLFQSVVDATPQRMGQTCLRHFYDLLHRLDDAARLHGSSVFYRHVELDASALADLVWWDEFLSKSLVSGAQSRTQFGGSLCVTWGDGSGTGTGGTVEFPATLGSLPTLTCWMGTWAPHVHHFSSNWRELRTLLGTLERGLGNTLYRHRTVFYFTDNMVTYYVVQSGSSGSPELHKLIRRIKELEVLLMCRLEVVHVPGTLMIVAGPDGLSRGVWLTADRMRTTTSLEASRVFEPLPLTYPLAAWAMTTAGLPGRCFTMVDESSPWDFGSIAHQLTVWSLQPETARQTLSAYLAAWVEVPATTGGLFLVPRVLQREWGSLSRYVQRVGEFTPADLPVSCRHLIEVPIVLLFITPHVPVLPSASSLDAAPSGTSYARWHATQRATLQGLYDAL